MSAPEGSTVSFRRVPPKDVRPRAIQQFAQKLRNKVARGAAFDCLLTGDSELRQLNSRYRGKDCPTDVLSFPSGAFGSLGDIAISLQRARTQAREFEHSTETEVRILMLHGLLHLMGMDHETDGGRMARAEKRWRTRLELPGGLIERVRA
jgi:probable rRNA maturation factor